MRGKSGPPARQREEHKLEKGVHKWQHVGGDPKTRRAPHTGGGFFRSDPPTPSHRIANLRKRPGNHTPGGGRGRRRRCGSGPPTGPAAAAPVAPAAGARDRRDGRGAGSRGAGASRGRGGGLLALDTLTGEGGGLLALDTLALWLQHRGMGLREKRWGSGESVRYQTHSAQRGWILERDRQGPLPGRSITPPPPCFPGGPGTAVKLRMPAWHTTAADVRPPRGTGDASVLPLRWPRRRTFRRNLERRRKLH